MMKRIALVSLVVLVAALLIWSRTRSAATQMAKSEKPRSLAADVSQADIRTAVADNTAFACALYRRLGSGDDNLVFSPYSISTALAMTYAGARGKTAREMAAALHFTLPQERLHAALNSLDLSLARRPPDRHEGPSDLFRLDIANSLWAQQDYRFLPAFLDSLAANYGAGVRLVDFAGDPEGGRRAVNEWADEATQGKIKDLLPEGTVDPLVRLILANAVYFKDKWQEPFEKKNTKRGVFHRLDGSTVNAEMMSQPSLHTRYGSYGSGIGYEVFALPYRHSGCEMVVILPQRGSFRSVEELLVRRGLADAVDSLQDTQISLTMPKFHTNVPADLVPALQAMGMKSAFSRSADFSGMDGTTDLLISQVRHRADITVDEEGTEAAAATAVVMELKSIAMPAPIRVVVDRPFIYLIRHAKTGSVLFLGRVINPTA